MNYVLYSVVGRGGLVRERESESQAPRKSGAQVGDPDKFRPTALGETPSWIHLEDSCPDGGPSVSDKVPDQTIKGLNLFVCQIGGDRRCAARTRQCETIRPDHLLELRRQKSGCGGVPETVGSLRVVLPKVGTQSGGEHGGLERGVTNIPPWSCSSRGPLLCPGRVGTRGWMWRCSMGTSPHQGPRRSAPPPARRRVGPRGVKASWVISGEGSCGVEEEPG
ncbi:uncharacterized protein LOC133547931 isoform X2 [Nerophis ophidion]|uniref:uncharacterized protein LOC133547931 isoform X2 n=2 Tax=Nerophis ophidion TaxID=159077 RepID=UPI002ADF96AD|nr:uncharacterized protein LOC133547931 isoform X2 [Nerophis ophidion]